MGIFTKLFNKQSLLDAIPNILYTNLDTIEDLSIEFVCIDSRMAVENSLFICYVGDKNNGHDFIENAIRQGATCIIVEDFSLSIQQKINDLNVAVIHVKSTTETLFTLAKYKRNLMDKTKFIAITGSSGKTTVKTMITSSLRNFFSVGSTYKSYNNNFGVPLTILNLDPNCNIAVVEIGTNHMGEIEPLAKLVNPDIAIITMIGRSHIGNFPNGVADIIQEKTSIFKGLKPGGVAILNEANEFFKETYKNVVSLGIKNIVRIGKPESSHLYLGEHSFTNYCTTNFEVIAKESTGLKAVNCSLNGIIYHNAINTLFTFAVARLFKIQLENISKSINSISIVEGRGNIEHLYIDNKKIMIINDTHNCSFEALKSSIETLSIFKKQNPNRRAVCFLGDMGETGDLLEEYHTKISEYVINSGIDKVYCVGDGMKYLYDSLPENLRGQHFKHIGALVKVVRSKIEDQDMCLFKAKRVITMEKAIEKLYMV